MPLLPTLRTTGGLAILLVSACAPVGPDHTTPAIDLPTSFSHAGITWKRQNPTAPNTTTQEWWKMFQDPTLDSLVRRSLNHNQEINAAAARVREAREISNMARSRYFPAVDMGLGAERTRFRFRGPGGGDNLASNFTLPIDLRYEIDTWGKVRRQVEAAKAREQASTNLLAALRLTVSAEIAQTYWALRAVDADRAVLKRTLEIRTKAFDLLASRRNAGTISGLDLARAETELAAANADRIQLDQTRAELINALAVLTGRAAPGSSLPENASLPTPPQPPRVLPASLLRQRPDIRAAEQNVAAANAEIGVATAAYFPAVSLQASSGLDSATLENLFDASSLVWSLGANALTPLTNLRFLQAQRRAAVAAHEAASAEYRQAALEALREVETAFQTTSILLHRQNAQDQALAAARKAFELAVKRFEQGLVSFLDVVEAERTRLDAERASNAIRAERLAVSVSLAKALGGTW